MLPKLNIPKSVIMEPSDELRHIAGEIIRTMAGGLEASQYWGLRLKLIASKIDAILTSAMHSDGEILAVIENELFTLDYVDSETIRLTRRR